MKTTLNACVAIPAHATGRLGFQTESGRYTGNTVLTLLRGGAHLALLDGGTGADDAADGPDDTPPAPAAPVALQLAPTIRRAA